MMNGYATMLPDDSSVVTKPEPAKVKGSVTSKFVSGMKGFFGGNSRSISWAEFVRDYLGRGRVDRLEVTHDGWHGRHPTIHNRVMRDQADSG